ncbi:hypothetical protein QEN19_002872 [Hanseniaspora menglaensis]
MHIGDKMAEQLSGGSQMTEASVSSDAEQDTIIKASKLDKFDENSNIPEQIYEDNIKNKYLNNDKSPELPARYVENEKLEREYNTVIEEPFVKENSRDLLENQRIAIKTMYDKSVAQLQDSDSVYLFPKDWFFNFLNKPVEDISEDITLQEVFGVPQVPNHINSTNYTEYLDSDMFIPLTSDIIAIIYKHYGFEGNLIEVFLKLNDEGLKVIDPVFLHLQTVLLVENIWQTNQTQPISFYGSRQSTLARLFQLAANHLEQHLSLENIDKRFWVSIADKNENEVQNFLLVPHQFLMLNNVDYIDHTMADQKLLHLSHDKIISLIVEVNFTGSWPSLHHLYNSKENTDSGAIKPTGTLGLNNLGNTCFMNSALQCLVHIPELSDYFSYGCYKDELNLNNPLGYDGKIAKAFGELIEELYDRGTTSQASNAKSISPRAFKMNLGICNAMFAGYYQQDSQEFLSFLLDGLHEDLNRVKNKPYVENAQYGINFDYNDQQKVAALANETWEKYKLRNDSVIQDLFVGLFKSTLICPDCKHVSVTFDPFNDLSLPIPVEASWRKQLYILPLNDKPHTLELELRYDSKYTDLKAEVAKHVQTDVENLVGFEFYSSSIFKCFENESSGSGFLPIGDLINQEDITFFVELGAYDEKKDIIVPVYNSCETASKRFSNMTNEKLCGYPLLLKLEKSRIGDFEYIVNNIAILLANYTIFDPFDIDENVRSELSVQFEQKLMSISFKNKLSDDLVSKLKCYKDCWILYKNCNKLFDLQFLENRQSVDFNDEENNKVEKVQIPVGKLNLNTAINLSHLSTQIFKELFEDEPDRLNSREDAKSESVPESTNDFEFNKDAEFQVKADISDSDDMIAEQSISSLEGSLVKGTIEKVLDSASNLLLKKLTLHEGIFVINWKLSQEDQERIYKNPGTYSNTQLQEKKLKMAKTEKTPITLEDCLNLFTRTETLSLQNSWYCPSCKNHKQADKQIQIWELPDILCVHLKRFKNQSSFSDKINELINFPLENFDLAPYVTKSDSGKEYIYDLIGVDNHYGGIGGGHYTAFAKNFNDDNWYYFNDSRVTKENVEDSVTEAAYLLFYKRRCSVDTHSKLTADIALKKTQYEMINKKLDEKQKHIAILLENHGVSILDESDEEATTSGDEEGSGEP